MGDDSTRTRSTPGRAPRGIRGAVRDLAVLGVVGIRVTEFLTNCATQQVLQPSGCPFGYVIRNRIADLPEWSIVSQPTIALEPDGNAWRITPAPATAHIRVDVRSLFDGRIREVDDDVPFTVTGTVTVEADGSATITVTTPSG